MGKWISGCLNAVNVAVVTSFFFTVFIPLNAYVSNVQEFPLARPLPLIVASVTCWLLLFALLSLLLTLVARFANKSLPVVLALICGPVLALYVQGNLIGLKYGVLDGTEIPWDKMVGAGIVNTIVWLAVLAVPIAFAVLRKAKSLAVFRIASGIFVAYLVLITVMRMASLSPKEGPPLEFSSDGMMTLSGDRNVVVIVIDTLEQEMFERLLESHPEIHKGLDGFTYYRNTIGKFTSTALAFPQLLTGFDEASPDGTERPYLERSLDASRHIHEAAAEEFVFDVYSEPGFVPGQKTAEDLGCFGNLRRSGQSAADVLNYLTDVVNSSMFTYLPHFLKRYHECLFIPHCKDAGVLDICRVEKMFFPEGGVAHFNLCREKRFKVYHLWGVHPPDYNEAKGVEVFGRVFRFLEAVKRHGLWEKTSVVILGDHGMKQRHRPAFLCNNRVSGFAVSDIPFSYGSLGDVYCQARMSNSIEIPESPGIRTFFYTRRFNARGEEMRALPKSIYRGADLQLIGRDLYEKGGSQPPVESNGESFYFWTSGSAVSMDVPVPPSCTGKPLQLAISAHALLGAKMPEQAVDFVLNGNDCGVERWTYPDQVSRRVCFYLPATFNTGDVVRVEMRGLKDVSPAFLGVNPKNERQLGICVSEVALQVDEPCADFAFNVPWAGTHRLLSGFSRCENDGCWTTCPTAELVITIPREMRQGSVRMVWTVVPFAPKGKVERQRLKIVCEGQALYERALEGFEAEEVRFALPPTCMKDGAVGFRLELPDTVSPSAVGFNADPRPLGVSLRTCHIEHQ